jgi:hypothetical protein
MQKYSDGNFAAANQRLNQLAALLKWDLNRATRRAAGSPIDRP